MWLEWIFLVGPVLLMIFGGEYVTGLRFVLFLMSLSALIVLLFGKKARRPLEKAWSICDFFTDLY